MNELFTLSKPTILKNELSQCMNMITSMINETTLEEIANACEKNKTSINSNTTRYQQVQIKCPTIREVSFEVFKMLKKAMNINLYHSNANIKPENQTYHHDQNPLLVYQLEGEKNWKFKTTDETTICLKISRGQWLFIPEGVPHLAYSENKPSAHLTLSFYSFNQKEFIKFLTSKLESSSSNIQFNINKSTTFLSHLLNSPELDDEINEFVQKRQLLLMRYGVIND